MIPMFAFTAISFALQISLWQLILLFTTPLALLFLLILMLKKTA